MTNPLVQKIAFRLAEQVAAAREEGIVSGMESITVAKVVSDMMIKIEELETEVNNLVKALSEEMSK